VKEIKLIETLLKTFYPNLEYHIHVQFKNHDDMNYPDKWEYHIELLNVVEMIYNPEDFTPIYKLSNGERYDLGGIHTKVYQFFPNLYDKVKSFWVMDNGSINGIHRTNFEEMVDIV
jgi:hypothetical protein